MTFPLRIYDTLWVPAAAVASWPSPAKALASAGRVASQSMAAPPNPGPSALWVAARGLAAIGYWRLLAVAMPHLAALVIMLRTQTHLGSRRCFMLAWGILNCLFIALLRRPALSGALALTLVVVLVLLSRL